jgi:hypothetical protein
MYSAYVLSGALLHDYLFASDHYAQPGSPTFHHWSPLWGGDPKHFEYERNSLTEQIYWEIVKNGFLGVACEPNCIFQICNQPAILGFRLHDLICGGDRATEVIANYEKAWSDFGRLDDNGHYNILIAEDSHVVMPNVERAAWSDAWLGMLMSMWNKEFVRRHYRRQISSHVVDAGEGCCRWHRHRRRSAECAPIAIGLISAGWRRGPPKWAIPQRATVFWRMPTA